VRPAIEAAAADACALSREQYSHVLSTFARPDQTEAIGSTCKTIACNSYGRAVMIV
jgi:hypothetical protein